MDKSFKKDSKINILVINTGTNIYRSILIIPMSPFVITDIFLIATKYNLTGIIILSLIVFLFFLVILFLDRIIIRFNLFSNYLILTKDVLIYKYKSNLYFFKITEIHLMYLPSFDSLLEPLYIKYNDSVETTINKTPLQLGMYKNISMKSPKKPKFYNPLLEHLGICVSVTKKQYKKIKEFYDYREVFLKSNITKRDIISYLLILSIPFLIVLIIMIFMIVILIKKL